MLEIKNISFGFKRKEIFKDLSMVFKTDMVTGIVGKNGVGKTTFFRVVTGIYKQQEGAIFWKGQALRKQEIAFLPTDPYFYPYMKGKEYIDLVVSGENRNMNRLYADRLQLPLDNLVDTYSTGMKKKLAFSTVISQDRPIQILDEPFNGVDLEGNEHLKHLIKQQKQQKVTLISSHILSTLTDICDNIYYITDHFNCTLYEKDEFEKLRMDIGKEINLTRVK